MFHVLCLLTSFLGCIELGLEVVHYLLLIPILSVSLSPVLSQPLQLGLLYLDLHLIAGFSYLYPFNVLLFVNCHLLLPNDFLILDLYLEKSFLFFIGDSLNSELFSFILDNSGKSDHFSFILKDEHFLFPLPVNPHFFNFVFIVL